MSSCTAYKSTRILAGLATLQIAVNSRPTPSVFHSRIPVRSQRAASPLISHPPPTSSSHGVRSHNLRQAPPASMPKKQESSILKHVERIRASRAAHSAKSPTIPWPSSTKRSTSPVACGPRVPQARRPTPPQRSTTPPRQVSSTSVASKDSSESTDSSLQRELELVAALESNGAGFGNIVKQPRVNSSRVDRSISNHVRRIRTVSDCQRAIEAIPRPTPTTLRLRALNAKFKSKGIRTIDLEFIERRPR